MNPLTFNDPFYDLLGALADGVEAPPHDSWERAPLFDYTTTEQHEWEMAQWRRENIDLRLALPFPVVRVALTQTDAKDASRGRYKADFVASAPQDAEELFCAVRVKKMFDEIVLKDPNRSKIIEFILADVEWQSHEPAPEGKPGYACRYNAAVRYDGKWLNPGQHKALAHYLGELIDGAMNAFTAFCIDAMLPQTHIAMVKPDQPTRSIEWMRPRLHYTLITHGHPANRPMREGATVAVDRAAELTRMAGNRRAHWRTYKHERYRFARGDRRWIKQTWVGPKEWREAGSKQIYSILTPKQ